MALICLLLTLKKNGFGLYPLLSRTLNSSILSEKTGQVQTDRYLAFWVVIKLP
jgi:hypothetical protein